MEEQLSKYFSGELTASERLEFIHRVENDSQLKAEFIRLQNLSAVSKLSSHPSDSKEGEENYKKFTVRIKQKARRTFAVNILKYAAIAVVLVASTVWATLFLQDRAVDSTLNTLYVPAGQRARITLQDGTEVWLNAQSTLTYPSHFSKKNREVDIVGEAFFDVAKDKKPFIVSTQDIELQVLGTQFNVYAYPDADYIQTDLVEGSLRVVEKSNRNNMVLLTPSEQMVFKENKMMVSSLSNPARLLWREGIYSFENEPLRSIIDKLQLYYDVKIIVEDPEIFNVRYTGKFRQRDGIDEILRIIQKIHPFKIKKDTEINTITLSK